MSGYDYVNGCYVVHTPIHEGFKRYRRMNAQYRILHINNHGKLTDCKEAAKMVRYEFVSYDTVMMIADYYPSFNQWVVQVNGDNINYSISTQRQLRTFINEMGIPTSMYEILTLVRDGINVTDTINPLPHDDSLWILEMDDSERLHYCVFGW